MVGVHLGGIEGPPRHRSESWLCLFQAELAWTHTVTLSVSSLNQESNSFFSGLLGRLSWYTSKQVAWFSTCRLLLLLGRVHALPFCCVLPSCKCCSVLWILQIILFLVWGSHGSVVGLSGGASEVCLHLEAQSLSGSFPTYWLKSSFWTDSRPS